MSKISNLSVPTRCVLLSSKCTKTRFLMTRYLPGPYGSLYDALSMELIRRRSPDPLVGWGVGHPSLWMLGDKAPMSYPSILRPL